MTTTRISSGQDVTRIAARPTRTPFWRAETIGQKLGLGFLVILLLLALSGVVAYYEMSSVGLDAAAMENASMQAMEASHLQRLSETVLLPVHDYVLTGDPAARDRFDKSAAELEAILTEFGVQPDTAASTGSTSGMEGMATPVSTVAPMEGMNQSGPMALTPEQLTLLGAFNDLWTSVRAGAQSILEMPDPLGNEQVLRQLEGLEASAQSMAAFAQSIHLAEMQSVRLSRESANTAIRNTSLFLIGAVVTAVVVGAILSRLISLAISRPMAQLTQMATNVSLGELDTKVEVRSKGEIGELANAIERMRTSLKMTIERLAEEEEDLRSWTAHLVDKELKRKVRGGAVTLGGQRYDVGRELEGQFVYVKRDYDLKEIVITPSAGDPKRLPMRG